MKNEFVILKLLKLDSWSDSAGKYATITSIIRYDGKDKYVTLFVCSDYPNQLTVWDGEDPDFCEESILFDIDINECRDNTLCEVHKALLNQINTGLNNGRIFNLSITEDKLEVLCKKYKKDISNLNDWQVQELIDKAINDLCSID